MTVKRKCGRPPKPKPQIPTSKTRTTTVEKNLTTQPRQRPRSLNNEMLGSNCKVAPFIKGAAPTVKVHLAPFINGATCSIYKESSSNFKFQSKY